MSFIFFTNSTQSKVSKMHYLSSDKYSLSDNLNVTQLYDLMFDYEFTTNTSLFVYDNIRRAITISIYGRRRYSNGSIEDESIEISNPIQTHFDER